MVLKLNLIRYKNLKEIIEEILKIYLDDKSLQIVVQIQVHLDRDTVSMDGLVHHELGHLHKDLEAWHYHNIRQRTHHNDHPLYCDCS